MAGNEGENLALISDQGVAGSFHSKEALKLDNLYILSAKKKHTYETIKRLFDIFFSLFSLVVLWPLFLIVAIAIKLESRGPVIYTQMRVGNNRKPFKMYKFRSMCKNADEQLHALEKLNERDGPVFKITEDPRVTRVGKLLRKICIDELPQLINIIKGEMSIVGPRPPLLNEVEKYNFHHMRRLEVIPGLTCYWQTRKEEKPNFEEWVEMDLQYIANRSFREDIKIIFTTAKIVLQGKGNL